MNNGIGICSSCRQKMNASQMADDLFESLQDLELALCVELDLIYELSTHEDILKALRNLRQGLPIHQGIDNERRFDKLE